tara:strand:- start:356 stop:895 length:540 start_codon:yes stop_codon:yes gene_type:complete
MKNFIVVLCLFTYSNVFSQELVIGEERLEPGIIFIFEGAVKDKVYPISINLDEESTDVHIEARVNWDINNIPEGTPAGGFIPYINISTLIINQTTNQKVMVDLIPHINLVDNFHYAKNISLPGNIDDMYKVLFIINPPEKTSLYFHKDWVNLFSDLLFDEVSFEYLDINFKEIAKASRN